MRKPTAALLALSFAGWIAGSSAAAEEEDRNAYETVWVPWVQWVENGPWTETMESYLAETVCLDQCEFMYSHAHACTCRRDNR